MVETASPQASSRVWLKWVVLGVVAVAAAGVYVRFGSTLSLDQLADHASALQDIRAAHPIGIFGAAFALYTAVTGLSLPGAAALTLIFGWFFGFGAGLILVSFASTSGATLAFLLSRYLLRESVQRRFGERLIAVNAALKADGAFYLFTLRLVPAIPFFVINLVMGLTPIRVSTYWWVSQLGMLPGTAVYVYAGATVPDLQTLSEQGAGSLLSVRLITAFALLGLLPWFVKWLLARWRRPAGVRPASATSETDPGTPGSAAEGS